MGSGKSMKSVMGIMGTKGKGKGMGMGKGMGKGMGMGIKGKKGNGQGLTGYEGLGSGLGLESTSEGQEGLGLGLGLEGIKRSKGSGEMGAMGVEGITGLGQPTLRAIACDQLTFPLQRECYSIPVVHIRERAWSVEITPALHMPGYGRKILKLTENDARDDLQFDDPDWRSRSE